MCGVEKEWAVDTYRAEVFSTRYPLFFLFPLPVAAGEADGENTLFVDALGNFMEPGAGHKLIHLRLRAAAHGPGFAVLVAGQDTGDVFKLDYNAVSSHEIDKLVDYLRARVIASRASSALLISSLSVSLDRPSGLFSR